jgi:hypothetical protein
MAGVPRSDGTISNTEALGGFLADANPPGCFAGTFLLIVSLTFIALAPAVRTFPFWHSTLLLACCIPLAVLLALLLGVLGMFFFFVIIVMPTAWRLSSFFMTLQRRCSGHGRQPCRVPGADK